MFKCNLLNDKVSWLMGDLNVGIFIMYIQKWVL